MKLSIRLSSSENGAEVKVCLDSPGSGDVIMEEECTKVSLGFLLEELYASVEKRRYRRNEELIKLNQDTIRSAKREAYRSLLLGGTMILAGMPFIIIGSYFLNPSELVGNVIFVVGVLSISLGFLPVSFALMYWYIGRRLTKEGNGWSHLIREPFHELSVNHGLDKIPRY